MKVVEVLPPEIVNKPPGLGVRTAAWWILALAYGIANILLHEQVNAIFKYLVEVMGLSLFLWTMRLAALAGAGAVLAFRWKFLQEPGKLRRVVIFIAVGMALDLSLVIYASERIHYPQYAILTWIAFKATGVPLPAGLLSFAFGYVDEAYQHWALYSNDPIAYFDWNDIVLNLLGVLSALVLLPAGNTRSLPLRRMLTAMGVWAVAVALLVLIFNPDPGLMRAHTGNSFWITSNIKTHYHVLNALEGSILLGVIWIVTIGCLWPVRTK